MLKTKINKKNKNDYKTEMSEKTRERNERDNGLICFYGISTIVSYLMPNIIYTFTLNIYPICKRIL